MKRGGITAVAGALALVGAMLVLIAVRQEREYRRLVAAGDAALAGGLTFEAIEDFSGALALKRDSMLAHLKRGDSYRRRGELAAALRDLRQASSLDPTATRPLELLGDVNVAMGRYERAVDEYRRYLTLDDRAPRVLYKLALAHYRHGQAALALDPLRRAIAQNDRLVEAHYLLGLCLRDRNRDLEAVRALTRAIQVDPAFGPAREELADLNLDLGRNRDGIEQLEALAALDASHPEPLARLALTYARLGRTESAISTLARATERYPDSDIIRLASARIWLELADPSDNDVALRNALDAVQPVATRADASGDALTLYGRLLLRSNDAAGSERALERATAALPAQPEAFLYLSQAAERQGHVPAARNALIRYITLIEDDNRERELSRRAADLSLRMNDPDAAITWALRAVNPERPDIGLLAILADAQVRAGKIDDARGTIANGLEHDPSNRTLLNLRRKIGA